MTEEEKCPKECQLKLDVNAGDIEELKGMNTTQWEQIDKRVKVGTLLTVTSIVVGILGALLGAIYFQISQVRAEVSGVEDQMHKVQVNVVRLETKLDIHTDTHNSRHPNQ